MRSPMQRSLGGLAVALLVAALLMPCPFHGVEALSLLGTLSSLLTGVTQTVANSLGLVGGTVTTVTGVVVDVTALLSARYQCSGPLCVDMQLYVQKHGNLADINAKVLLWSPKVPNSNASKSYDPRTKDWASVVAACRSVFTYEKRLANFFIRSAFHDSMAVDVTQCPGPNCGGADSSLLLSVDEMMRPENAYDDFSLLTARVAKKVASFFDVSVADTLAVCAAVATDVLSNGRNKILTGAGAKVLRVGRMDSIRPSPPGQLPAAEVNVTAFHAFWKARGINGSEAMALMGSHSLLDSQGCLMGPKPGDYCDPSKGQDCKNVRMFRWENHYFHDICAPALKVTRALPDADAPADTPVLGMSDPEFQAEENHERCKFTSYEGRLMVNNTMRLMRAGKIRPGAEAVAQYEVDWNNDGCTASKAWGVNTTAHCPHPRTWFYTTNDAFLGRTCQGEGASPEEVEVRNGARLCLSTAKWDALYRNAYIKMVTNFAQWSPAAASSTNAVYINGGECPSGSALEPSCAQSYAGTATADTNTLFSGNYMPPCTVSLLGLGLLCPYPADYCKPCTQGGDCTADVCNTCVGLFNKKQPSNALVTTPRCCGCETELREYRYNATSTPTTVNKKSFTARFGDVMPMRMAADPFPDPGALVIPERQLDEDYALDSVAPVITVGGAFAEVPITPYDDPAKVCPSTPVSVRVGGYPSSPFVWTPFQLPFAQPPQAQRANKYCKFNGTQELYCTDAYEMDVYPVLKDVGCPAGPTWLLSYNGSVPGPTIRQLKGRQSLVRFNNRLTAANLSGSPFGPFMPCDTSLGREGRPTAVHHHGEASLAPFDGWAEDTSCGGETKDYYYANRRPATQWYHDHQLELTADNAYYGLSGFYTVHDRAAEGGCGEQWNLDSIPETVMQFKDAVFDAQCQLYYDHAGPHKNNLYGDVNLVNGIPWPVMTFEPRWQRFRWLSAAVSRPWKLRIVDSAGADVSGTICKAIASDGGYRRSPAPFPAAGLFMGVAERYEVVCDFTSYAGRTLYLMNTKDEKRMKAVPFFCHSHLVAKINVSPCPGGAATCAPAGSDFPAAAPAVAPTLDAVLSDAIVEEAKAMVVNKNCTRTFRFGRRNGHWVINGETWHTLRVAAGDVGHNTWEVWCLETGGGWFHPIHIHLVDFYVLARSYDLNAVHAYEAEVPKDVVQLNPSTQVSLLIRFGPHRGEYMFHCHNLVHEDYEMMRSLHVVPTSVSKPSWNETTLALNRQPAVVRTLDVIYDLYDDPLLADVAAVTTSTKVRLWTPSPSTNTTLRRAVDGGFYRIFYPGAAPNESPLLADASLNPWLVKRPCQAQANL